MGLEVGSINTGKSSGLYCGQFVRNNKMMLIVSDGDPFKKNEDKEIQKKIDAVLERKYAPDPSGKMAEIDKEIEKMVYEKYPEAKLNPRIIGNPIIYSERQRAKYRNELREAVKRTNPEYKKYRDLQDKYDEEYNVLSEYYRKKFTPKKDYLLL